MRHIKTISPTDLFRLQQESGGITVIDVRESDEFAEVASPLSENLPLSTFAPSQVTKHYDKRTELYMMCRSGRRSLHAAQLLYDEGFLCVYNVEGGLNAWEAAGLPVVKAVG